jgi:hypothetical protein
MPERTRPVVDISATCACGAVTVAIKGTVYSMFMCSCEDCQKASGTGHSAAFVVDPSSLTVTGKTRSFARPAASGATLTHTFCPTCGTPLHGSSSRNPRGAMIPVGLFGKAAAEWYLPNQLIFSRSHREWDVIAAELPRHDTYRERQKE